MAGIMGQFAFCSSIDDVAYDGYSTEEHLAEYLDFCNGLGMKSTLFTVPLFDDKDFRERSGYTKLLRKAISQGHEVAQHGLRHDRFETGVPPPFIMALPHEGPARDRLAKDRDLIERENSVGNIRQRLALGRGILEQALDTRVRGFRGGSGSSCPNLYTALNEESYEWDSTCIVQESGWDLILGDVQAVPKPITRERFAALQHGSALKELPLTTDYTWYLTADKYDASLSMAKHDLDSCMEAGIPFVPICHVSPIKQCEDDCGYELYRELVAYARAAAAKRGVELSFMTMSEASRMF
jgi:hypothetical protein